MHPPIAGILRSGVLRSRAETIVADHWEPPVPRAEHTPVRARNPRVVEPVVRRAQSAHFGYSIPTPVSVPGTGLASYRIWILSTHRGPIDKSAHWLRRQRRRGPPKEQYSMSYISASRGYLAREP